MFNIKSVSSLILNRKQNFMSKDLEISSNSSVCLSAKWTEFIAVIVTVLAADCCDSYLEGNRYVDCLFIYLFTYYHFCARQRML